MREPLAIPHLASRETPLLKLGFSPANATWLTLVCFHSGVFTRRQYTEFHQCHRSTTHHLVHDLIGSGIARERMLPDTAERITHVYGRKLYRLLGIENVRHRRNALPLVFLRRLLSLDHVLDHLDQPWLATEQDKVAYFVRRGVPHGDLPQRTYAGALNNTRRYFPLKLPVAADDHVATFLYADPGRDSQTELRSWADGHARLWTLLRDAGTSVHVAVVTRDPLARDNYDRTLATWLTAEPSADRLTPDERSTLNLIENALASGADAPLRPWGGIAAARQTALRLRQRADNPASTPALSIRIDSFSTHNAPRLAADSLLP